jgi:hypothetical protein
MPPCAWVPYPTQSIIAPEGKLCATSSRALGEEHPGRSTDLEHLLSHVIPLVIVSTGALVTSVQRVAVAGGVTASRREPPAVHGREPKQC